MEEFFFVGCVFIIYHGFLGAVLSDRMLKETDSLERRMDELKIASLELLSVLLLIPTQLE
jgi:hypothetical protein